MSNLNQQSFIPYWLQRQDRWLQLIDHAAKLNRHDLVAQNIQGYLDSIDAMLR